MLTNTHITQPCLYPEGVYRGMSKKTTRSKSNKSLRSSAPDEHDVAITGLSLPEQVLTAVIQPTEKQIRVLKRSALLSSIEDTSGKSERKVDDVLPNMPQLDTDKGSKRTLKSKRVEEPCAVNGDEKSLTQDRKRLRIRLSKIVGQVNGIQRMVDEDRYCVDILTQIAAARSALDKVSSALLMDHIAGCIVGHGTETEHAGAKQQTPNALLSEVRVVIERFLR